ncbi:MAG: 1,4-alpha-glucan branching protein GlgB [Deltaproteobacteria bacterium]|nr:1,4-alpha-glucan branching protein GlgB [Deltaproteobacteria bacterium]
MSDEAVGAAGPIAAVRHDASLLGEQDVYLFNEGSHLRLQERLGAHLGVVDGVAGAHFAVWAPNAASVAVMGDWNGWSKSAQQLRVRGESGVWEGFLPGVVRGAAYKYHVVSRHGGYAADKADPFAVYAEVAPRTGSRVWTLDYEWGDAEWLARRARCNAVSAPMSVYEVHVGSWRRDPRDPSRMLTYRELAPLLAEHVARLGFTHVELLPVMEHPYYPSWGYQTTGYFAASSRWGTPQDLMFLIDSLHQAGIGVILDWVPSHFPTDEHGLGYFDGTHLYEHGDPRQGFHPDWQSFIFNYGRNEVRSFLLSSARFWIEQYHADGLRVDAVASMLYLDYSRKSGEWIPNRNGGRENLDAIDFLRRMNVELYGAFPDVQTTAEESTAWPLVSRPTYVGGLGFGFKWDMGWMHDTLAYMSLDPMQRKFDHGKLTFRGMYAFSEHFVLPLSHDEVVHGKGSLLRKMPGGTVPGGTVPGDHWQRYANLRLLLGWMFGQPGKKLLFMGAELATWNEWYQEVGLDWDLLALPAHAGVERWVADLNALYLREPALHELDCDPAGFAWIDCSDSENSTLAFLRRGRDAGEVLLFACNFTPIQRHAYRIGVPRAGFWAEVLNGDAADYGGSGVGNLGGVRSEDVACHGHAQSIAVELPPLAVVVLAPERRPQR